MKRGIIRGYAEAAAELIPRYEAVAPSELYSEVTHLFPGADGRVIDIGAGTGRDAGWLAARGCRVLAVEPAAAFREVGATLHPSASIDWLDDSLPALHRALARGDTFDLVLLSAVWQHLDSRQRELAMPTLRALAAPGGRLVLSVRHGPGAPTRRCFSASAEEAIELARGSGFRLVFRHSAESRQAINRQAGVSWTWLGFSVP